MFIKLSVFSIATLLIGTSQTFATPTFAVLNTVRPAPTHQLARRTRKPLNSNRVLQNRAKEMINELLKSQTVQRFNDANPAFVDNFDTLAVAPLNGKNNEYRSYAYSIYTDGTTFAKQVALPKRRNLKAYIGIANYYTTEGGLGITESVICESQQPTQVSPRTEVQADEDRSPVCPTGYNKLARL
jgi:Type IV pilin-like G and H, putative